MTQKRRISIERQRQLRKPSGKNAKEVGAHLAYHNQGVNRGSIELLKIQEDDVVLEVGCGPGWAIERMLQVATQGKIYGIDPSPDMVILASERNQRAIDEGRVKIETVEVDSTNGIL